MTSVARSTFVVVFLTIVAAGAGVWLGLRIANQRDHHSAGLDEILHHELSLSVEQQSRIADIESRFSLERKDLEGQMRAANRDLARALDNEHSYGDPAKAAIARFHNAMAQLQEKTIQHIIDMRAVLTPEQAARFDKTVRDSLSADPP